MLSNCDVGQTHVCQSDTILVTKVKLANN